MPETGPSLVLSPEFERLKAQVEKLRAELAMRVLERDTLQFVEAKNLEMAYMLEIGATEYRVFNAQCAMLRAKRKLEMIRARKNRREPVDEAAIDAALDAEFEAYQKALDERLHAVNDALERSRCAVLTDEETKEIKRLYRQAVKALHPDLHPELTPEQLRLFGRAIDAYQSGDLRALRAICALIADDAPEEAEGGSAMDRLARERDRLTDLLRDIEARIERLQSEYPFTEKELLSHPEQVAARRAELEKTLRQYEDMTAYYLNEIEESLR